MGADVLLSRLDGVRRTGRDRWLARCPSHSDRRPSLSIRELNDGRLLIHDFGGCSVDEVLDALSLNFSDLFPDRIIDHGKRERQPFNARDVLSCVAHEALFVGVVALQLAGGETLSDEDRSRLLTASGRLQTAAGIADGR